MGLDTGVHRGTLGCIMLYTARISRVQGTQDVGVTLHGM